MTLEVGLVLAGFVLLPVAPLVLFEWRRRKFRYQGTGIGTLNVVIGFLGAILVALALQIITPPNLKLTSKIDPNSLTGKVVWNTRFEMAAIALGFLVGLGLGTIGATRPKRSRAAFDLSATDEASPAGDAAAAVPVVAAPAVRACPHCQAPMARESATCPHCHGGSTPWRLHEGTWWVESPHGCWHWLDETQRIWHRWQPAEAPTAEAT